MAGAIISAMLEMAAKAIATQIFSLLLSFIPGVGGMGNGINVNNTGASFFKFGYRGGLVGNSGIIPPVFDRPAKYAVGGLVRSGIPTRDTVPSMLSKGEFVMRRSAVESLGQHMLSDMNNRGAAALHGIAEKTGGGGGVVIPQAPVETNVYVVLPEEKPQLGPNDVLAIVQGDVLRNGSTKQLIQSVSRGN
jgi:hypothetical protein